MIRPKDIEELVRTIKTDMDACDIDRISVGLQTLVRIQYTDFIDVFGHSTTSYCLGNEIRIDVENITYCAQKQRGVHKDSDIPEGGD